MILLLLAMQGQTPKPAEPKPAVVRKFRPKQEDVYRVELTTIGSEIVRYEYEMRMKTEIDKPADKDVPILVVLGKMKSEVAGNKIERDTFGSIKIEMSASGFPKGMTMLGQTLPFSLPLLSFYLPEANISPEPYKTPLYDHVISSAGTAIFNRGSEFQVQASGRFFVEGEEKDQSMFRKLTMLSFFDPKSGALLRSSGKYTAPDGTVNFKVSKQ